MNNRRMSAILSLSFFLGARAETTAPGPAETGPNNEPSATPESHSPVETVSQWQARQERQLADTSEVERVVMLPKSGTLLLKFYYADGSKAVFKPNTKRFKSMPPALAVYKFVKNFNDSIKVRYTPLIKLSVSVESIRELLADNPKTPTTNEKNLAEKALENFALHPDGILTGSNATWADGVVESSALFHRNDRVGLLALASRLGTSESPGEEWEKPLSNLFVTDYLIANNDRAGNIHFDMDNRVVWGIDNDESFVASVKDQFAEKLIATLELFDQDYIRDLEHYFNTHTNEDMQKEIFTEYSEKYGLRFAKEMRERFAFVKARVDRLR